MDSEPVCPSFSHAGPFRDKTGLKHINKTQNVSKCGQTPDRPARAALGLAIWQCLPNNCCTAIAPINWVWTKDFLHQNSMLVSGLSPHDQHIEQSGRLKGAVDRELRGEYICFCPPN